MYNWLPQTETQIQAQIQAQIQEDQKRAHELAVLPELDHIELEHHLP
jgi:hypothetical protein